MLDENYRNIDSAQLIHPIVIQNVSVEDVFDHLAPVRMGDRFESRIEFSGRSDTSIPTDGQARIVRVVVRQPVTVFAVIRHRFIRPVETIVGCYNKHRLCW